MAIPRRKLSAPDVYNNINKFDCYRSGSAFRSSHDSSFTVLKRLIIQNLQYMKNNPRMWLCAVATCIVFVIMCSIWSYFLYVIVLTENRLSNTYGEQQINSQSASADAIVFNQQDIQINEFPVISKDFEKELQSRIAELQKIRVSVLNELRDLEQRRNDILSELAVKTGKLDALSSEISTKSRELDILVLSIEQNKKLNTELAYKTKPDIYAPLSLRPDALDSTFLQLPKPAESHRCTMEFCFDYSRCSIVSQFPVYIYPQKINDNSIHINYLRKQFMLNEHVTDNPSEACIYLALIDLSATINIQFIVQSLTYWNGDGRNHLIMLLGQLPNSTSFNELCSLNFGRAILASSIFTVAQFRHNYDIVIPSLLDDHIEEAASNSFQYFNKLPSISPAARLYFFSFWGQLCGENQHDLESLPARELSTTIETTLRKVQQQAKTNDKFYVKLSCQDKKHVDCKVNGEWSLCNNELSRAKILNVSTFSLIIAPVNRSIHSLPSVTQRVLEALKYGAVPVLLGHDIELPLNEVLDWNSVLIRLPVPRINELYFYLKSVSDFDILELRRRGRMFFHSYFLSSRLSFNSALSLLRERLNMPPSVANDSHVTLAYNNSTMPMKTVQVHYAPEIDEYLGAVELPYSSPRYFENFTQKILSRSYLNWNVLMDPFTLYPQQPIGSVLGSELMPSESKFLGSSYGFRPINDGLGGSGKEFSAALGGNVPREHFTIIILTFDRENVLFASLQRLNNLPYLNKIIVVWNGPSSPSSEMVWPKLTAPIEVVEPGVNSLNNRFLPFAAIDTEAILSIDDDMHLRHDEIIFAFRVWRENRDKIVGFPGRFHAWDSANKQWLYNSNHSCELSLVLTGAAFFHKYYSYVYSYRMSKIIRDKVDELMNCEDIAMNFLVAHITRKPPLKVTSRWTFRCPDCPEMLSTDDTHFHERHQCINFFTQIYGYNPLLYSQYRADSILFKTRIPHTCQKCFKFI